MKNLFIRLTLTTVTGILILTAVGFFICALYLFLVNTLLNASLAALYTGLILIGLAIILLLVLLLIKCSRRCKQKKTEDRIRQHFNLFAFVKEHPGETALAALAAGALVGGSHKVRKKIVKIIGLTIEEIGSSPEISQALAELLSGFIQDRIKQGQPKQKNDTE